VHPSAVRLAAHQRRLAASRVTMTEPIAIRSRTHPQRDSAHAIDRTTPPSTRTDEPAVANATSLQR
jgi:hypothetical protein